MKTKNKNYNKDLMDLLKNEMASINEYADGLDLLAEVQRTELEKLQKKVDEQRFQAKMIGEIINRLTSNKKHKDIKEVKSYNKNRVTFGDIILSFFEDGIPKTAKQLQKLYNEKVTEEKRLSDKSFSGSMGALKRAGKIKMHEFPNNPNSTKYIYGRIKWFEDNNMTKEYIDKVTFDK